jgi:hypothetical protein
MDLHFCLDTKVPKNQDCGKIAPKTDAPLAAISKLARPGRKQEPGLAQTVEIAAARSAGFVTQFFQGHFAIQSCLAYPQALY